jgi:hypothetical protein
MCNLLPQKSRKTNFFPPSPFCCCGIRDPGWKKSGSRICNTGLIQLVNRTPNLFKNDQHKTEIFIRKEVNIFQTVFKNAGENVERGLFALSPRRTHRSRLRHKSICAFSSVCDHFWYLLGILGVWCRGPQVEVLLTRLVLWVAIKLSVPMLFISHPLVTLSSVLPSEICSKSLYISFFNVHVVFVIILHLAVY